MFNFDFLFDFLLFLDDLALCLAKLRVWLLLRLFGRSEKDIWYTLNDLEGEEEPS